MKSVGPTNEQTALETEVPTGVESTTKEDPDIITDEEWQEDYYQPSFRDRPLRTLNEMLGDSDSEVAPPYDHPNVSKTFVNDCQAQDELAKKAEIVEGKPTEVKESKPCDVCDLPINFSSETIHRRTHIGKSS